MRRTFIEQVENITNILGDLTGKTVLDIGTMGGRLPALLVERGAIVTAIDTNPLPQNAANPDSYTFIQIPFEYFNTRSEKLHYDIAIAENVLPFLVDKHYSMQKFLDSADALVFNVWGSNHTWASNRLTYTPDQIQELKNHIQQTHDILSFIEREYDAVTIENTEISTHWHEYCFVVKRK